MLGAGSFGTALGCILARNGHSVCLLSRSLDVATSIQETHKNPRNFSDFTLPDNLTATSDPAVALHEATYVLHVIPVQHSTDYLTGILPHLNPTVPIISCSKVVHRK